MLVSSVLSSVVSRWPVHLSMISSGFFLPVPRVIFSQATGCFQTLSSYRRNNGQQWEMNESCVSDNHKYSGKNGPAGDRTSDLLFSSLVPYRLICSPMGKCNTFLSTYTKYRHLEKYCTHPSLRP